jgi:hypothetical protein
MFGTLKSGSIHRRIKKMSVETTTECQNENCDFEDLDAGWTFCPSCGRPLADQEDPPLIFQDSIIRLALYELDTYEFKMFMFIYMETEGAGLEWKRLKQEEFELECGISHFKVLKSLKVLKGPLIPQYESNAEEAEQSEEAFFHWVTSEKKLERWTKLQGYGIHDDLKDYERIKAKLEPYVKARNRRRRNYW